LARLKTWFIDRRIKGVTLHDARYHMPRDLRRYLFASHYARVHGESPRIADFPHRLRPAHKNVREAVREDLFSDRFRVQIRGKPASTVVSHISKDGHYYIHYDPIQCRSLTVREAARLQTFPDNYFFDGTRTSRYQQVGNAVPPLLARQMAAIVRAILAG
jgi:DNA (cytosine-5)-methyltransferase 1